MLRASEIRGGGEVLVGSVRTHFRIEDRGANRTYRIPGGTMRQGSGSYVFLWVLLSLLVEQLT
jgi:hypothetical protein